MNRTAFSYGNRTTEITPVSYTHLDVYKRQSEQEHIRQIFVNNGIDTEPVYDEYQEEYSW